MLKRKVTFIALLTLLIAVVIFLHFVPVDSRSGYLTKPGPNICIGYTQPVSYTYRWITGGVNAWDDQMSSLRPQSTGCTQPAHVRLYLF